MTKVLEGIRIRSHRMGWDWDKNVGIENNGLTVN